MWWPPPRPPASIYNAMPKEGVEALVEFLKKYEAEHA